MYRVIHSTVVIFCLALTFIWLFATGYLVAWFIVNVIYGDWRL